MTAENFAYWLKGYFELHAALARGPQGPDGPERSTIPSLSYEQVAEISRHLDYVFASKVVQQPGITQGSSSMPSDYIKGDAPRGIAIC